MATLVVSDVGARVVVRDRRLLVLVDGKPTAEAKLAHLDSILLFGQAEPSLATMRLALSRGIDLAFFTLDGRFVGRLQGPLSGSVGVRLAQLEAFRGDEPKRAFAAAVVRGKLANQRAVLLRSQRARPDAALAPAAARLRLLVKRIEDSTEVETLRGVEGAGAAAYFGALGPAIADPRFPFTGRNRRPPRDPVNAALSFGYGMLLREILGTIERVGLDPFVGALHEPAHGRPSLALDLMEEWRPVLVDSLVLRLIHRRQLSPTDFGPPERDLTAVVLAGEEVPDEPEPGAILLNRVGRKVLVGGFLGRMQERLVVDPAFGRVTYRAALEQQARRLARWLKDEGPPYQAYTQR